MRSWHPTSAETSIRGSFRALLTALAILGTAQIAIAQNPTSSDSYDLTPLYLKDARTEAAYRAWRDGDPSTARATLGAWLDSHRDDADAPALRYLLARMAKEDGAPEEALSSLEAIAGWAPLRSIVSLEVGDEWRRRGDRSRALAAYQMVRPGSPQATHAALAAAAIHREQGLLSDARANAEAALVTAPEGREQDDARLLLAGILAELGHKDEARSHLERLWWGRGHLESAAEKGLARLGAAPGAVEQLMRQVDEVGSRDLDDARKRFRRITDRRFKGAKNAALRLWIEAELLRRDRKTCDKATERYEAAWAKASDDPTLGPAILYGEAVSLRRQNRDLEAVERYMLLADRWPDHRLTPAALYGAGDLLIYRGLPVEAERPLRRLASEAPDSSEHAAALWELGFGAFLAGDHAAAIRTLDLLARTAPLRRTPAGGTWPERALYWKGRAEAAAGDPERALDTWQRLVERFPLTYYSTQAYNRIDELDPRTAEMLRHRAPTPPERDPEPLDLARYDVRRRPALDAAATLTRLGLYDEARDELEARLDAGVLPADGVLLLASLHLRDANPWRAVTGVRHAILMATYPDASSTPLWQYAFPVPFLEPVTRFAEENGLSPFLMLGVIRHESSFNPAAVSHANAIGLTQVLPATARTVATRLLGIPAPSVKDLKDPETNLRVGARFLHELLSLFRGNPVLALAAYNAGPYAVKRWLNENGHMQTDELLECLPYEATAAYVKDILTSAGAYQYLYGRQGDPAARTLPIPRELPRDYGPFMEPGAAAAAAGPSRDGE